MNTENLANKLIEILNNNTNQQTIRKQTLELLLSDGFKETTKNTYHLADPNGQSHIGKAYTFYLPQELNHSKFTRHKDTTGKHQTSYTGLKAIRNLAKVIKIKNDIAKGLYDIAEHLSESQSPEPEQ